MKKMINVTVAVFLILFLISCGGNDSSNETGELSVCLEDQSEVDNTPDENGCEGLAILIEQNENDLNFHYEGSFDCKKEDYTYEFNASNSNTTQLEFKIMHDPASTEEDSDCSCIRRMKILHSSKTTDLSKIEKIKIIPEGKEAVMLCPAYVNSK